MEVILVESVVVLHVFSVEVDMEDSVEILGDSEEVLGNSVEVLIESTVDVFIGSAGEVVGLSAEVVVGPSCMVTCKLLTANFSIAVS